MESYFRNKKNLTISLKISATNVYIFLIQKQKKYFFEKKYFFIVKSILEVINC